MQRVLALAGALLHPMAAPRGDIHAIWYNLESQSFEWAHRQPPDTSVPLRALADPIETLRWLRQWPLEGEREDLVNRALELSKQIREFPLSCAIVDGHDEARLRRMFQRLNTSGGRIMSLLQVRLGSVVVGTIERFDDDLETHIFCWDPHYLATPDRPVLGQYLLDRPQEISNTKEVMRKSAQS